MPTIRHIDELLGSAWAWDDDEDDLEGPSVDEDAPRGSEDGLAPAIR